MHTSHDALWRPARGPPALPFILSPLKLGGPTRLRPSLSLSHFHLLSALAPSLSHIGSSSSLPLCPSCSRRIIPHIIEHAAKTATGRGGRGGGGRARGREERRAEGKKDGRRSTEGFRFVLLRCLYASWSAVSTLSAVHIEIGIPRTSRSTRPMNNDRDSRWLLLL